MTYGNSSWEWRTGSQAENVSPTSGRTAAHLRTNLSRVRCFWLQFSSSSCIELCKCLSLTLGFLICKMGLCEDYNSINNSELKMVAQAKHFAGYMVHSKPSISVIFDWQRNCYFSSRWNEDNPTQFHTFSSIRSLANLSNWTPPGSQRVLIQGRWDKRQCSRH